jgi:hypothetical protein
MAAWGSHFGLDKNSGTRSFELCSAAQALCAGSCWNVDQVPDRDVAGMQRARLRALQQRKDKPKIRNYNVKDDPR